MTIAPRVLLMIRKLNGPILGIVENMGAFVCPTCHKETPIFSQGGGRKASQELGAPFLGEIPLDGEICEGGDDGRPIVVRNAASPVAERFRRLAGALAARVSVEALGAAGAAQPLPIVTIT
jgi:ATP-binding protein involved in chromosome partitioning